MSKWLFNSSGSPIEFVKNDKVFSECGTFVGRVDNNEVWNGEYIGEIYRDDRIVFKANKSSSTRTRPSTPSIPSHQ